MEILTSNQNSKIKHYKSLLLKKNRVKHGEYLVEGFHLCEMAQESGILKEVILTESVTFNFDNKVFVTPEIIKSLSDAKTPQPIIGVVELQFQEDIKHDQNILILDNIQNPGNLGSILRSALAFGFKNIVLSMETTDLFNPKVLRSAQGANFKLNIIKKDLLEYIPTINLPVIATDLAKPSISNNDIKLMSSPKCLIVGNEGQGIRNEVSKLATHNFIIKINEIDSLNVVVAASILMEKIK